MTLATSYFDLKEYERAAHALEGVTSPRAYFLYIYAQYLADETHRLDNAADSICTIVEIIFTVTHIYYDE